MGDSGNSITNSVDRHDRRLLGVAFTLTALTVAIVWFLSDPPKFDDAIDFQPLGAKHHQQRLGDVASDASAKPSLGPDPLKRPNPSSAALDKKLKSPGLQASLNTSYCYNRGDQAVIENPNRDSGLFDESLFDDQMKAWQKHMALARQTLKNSADPAHLFTAAALSEDPKQRANLIAKALDMAPNEPLLHAQRAYWCHDKRITNCNAQQLIDNWQRADPDNAEVWILKATTAYTANDKEGALRDLQRAANSDDARHYFFDSSLWFHRGLSGAGNSFADSFVGAFGLSASLVIPPLQPLTNMCSEASADSLTWARTCFSLGQLSEKHHESILGSAIGLALQNIAAEHLDDEELRIATKIRYASKNGVGFKPEKIQYNINDEWYMATHPTLFYDYIEHGRQHGEASAQGFLRTEIQRLRAAGTRSPCEKLEQQNLTNVEQN